MVCRKMRKYTEDERFMKEAIRQAKKAEAIGDVPIGCVIVCDGKIIARGYNKRNKNKTVLAHAELLAMSKACKKTGDWRLEDCTMYITLEPCQMCAGAIVQARIPRVVIGSMNPKAGCGGFHTESSADERIQSSGGSYPGRSGRRVFRDAV